MARNEGHKYEDKIKGLLKSLNLLPNNLESNDAGFIHFGKPYFLEIKSKNTSDYGARQIIWNSKNKSWEWNEVDFMTKMFDKIEVLNQIDENFIPYKGRIPNGEIDDSKKKFDQRGFERKIPLLNNANFIYEYYAQKLCFYIQIEGKGFYYLKEDKANLGVPQFSPQLNFIRLRAKTHHSKPIYKYSFRAEIQAKRNKIESSNYNLESTINNFPPIKK